MLRNILSLVCLLAICVGAQADVVIPAQYHTQNPNLHGGYCAFACAETAGRAAGYTQAGGLLHQRTQQPQYMCNNGKCGWQYNGGARPDLSDVQKQLADRGIPTQRCSGGSRCMPVLQQSIRTGQPAIVSYRIDENTAHAVIPHSMSRTKFYYYDPNYPGQIRSMSRQQFQSSWQGSVLVIGR